VHLPVKPIKPVIHLNTQAATTTQRQQTAACWHTSPSSNSSFSCLDQREDEAEAELLAGDLKIQQRQTQRYFQRISALLRANSKKKQKKQNKLTSSFWVFCGHHCAKYGQESPFLLDNIFKYR